MNPWGSRKINSLFYLQQRNALRAIALVQGMMYPYAMNEWMVKALLGRLAMNTVGIGNMTQLQLTVSSNKLFKKINHIGDFAPPCSSDSEGCRQAEQRDIPLC